MYQAKAAGRNRFEFFDPAGAAEGAAKPPADQVA